MKKFTVFTIAMIAVAFLFSCQQEKDIEKGTQKFLLEPINSISELSKKVEESDFNDLEIDSTDISQANFYSLPSPSYDGFVEAEILSFSGDNPKEILEDMTLKGYEPLPSPYLLDLFFQYEKLDTSLQRCRITTIDDKNILMLPSDLQDNIHPCYLSVVMGPYYHDYPGDFGRIGYARVDGIGKFGVTGEHFKFLVTKK